MLNVSWRQRTGESGGSVVWGEHLYPSPTTVLWVWNGYDDDDFKLIIIEKIENINCR